MPKSNDELLAEIAKLKDRIVRLEGRRTWPDLDTMTADLEREATPKAKVCPHCGKELERE